MSTSVYLPMWLPDNDYKRLATSPLENLDQVILAFALPAAGGGLELPPVSKSLEALVWGLFDKGVAIHLAIGGWGHDDNEHKRLLDYWRQAGTRPERFAIRVFEGVGDLERALHIEIAGIDLDWEYPGTKQAEQFTRIARHLRERLVGRLSVAAPAQGADLRGYEVAMGELLPLIDVWNVMTYDRVGSWSKKSGNHAPGSWTLACAEAWIRRVGAERVSIGFPAYGYLFPGTTAAGQQLTGEARPVMVSQLDLARVVDSPERLASGLITDDGWVTFQSPAMILEVRRRLAAMGVDKTFTWSAEGLDEEYLEALTI